MIVEIGHFALALALAVACVQAVLPMVGAARRIGPWIGLAGPAAMLQFLLIAIAFGALVQAYVASDFSVANVARNSHSLKPLLYKVAGAWGNHEGSMLLWVLILALFGAAVAAFGHNLPPAFRARVLGVQAWIGVGFLAFILFTSNPFERVLPAPVDGNDLNPLLQDPALSFHPPFLYVGYVGFSVAFAFAVAALIEGRVDPAWARWVRPWTLAAWAALTTGIGLGSWWAYYELGWGGFWFWDPVENASVLPWLAGTALLHSAVVVEKRDTLKGWTIFLAILAFALSLLGTFLVRSGVLTSVHAFATDPTRGVFILALLVVAIGGSFALFAARGPSLTPGGLFQPISREGGLLVNNLLITTAAAAILLGTLYPLLLDALGAGKVSVGAPYFNAMITPLAVPLLAAMGVGPLLGWKRGDLSAALGRLKIAAAVVVATGLGVWYLQDGRHPAAILAIAAAAWLATGVLVDLGARLKLGSGGLGDSLRRLARMPRSALGMSVAHFGLALVVAGVAGSAWQIEKIQTLKPGERIAIAGYEFRFVGATAVDGPNYSATRGTFAVSRGGRLVTELEPERRFYPVQAQTTTEAAIHPTIWGDLYAVIGEAEAGSGGFVTRLYFNPLVPWIWVGVLVMVTGGLLSLSDRRHRVGAPARARRPAPLVST